MSLMVMAVVLATGTGKPLAAVGLSAEEIVRRSVATNDLNWKVAPQYTYLERDVVLKGGTKTLCAYRNLMIDGWPYQELVAKNGKPLSPAQAWSEEQKLRWQIVHRPRESTAEREWQIQKYLRERRQDHELMLQMIQAFDFRLLGEETVNGHRCYVLKGTPRPDYRPIDRDTQVLKGMRGKLWVDTREFQWVKVHAEVFRPVAFGLIVARVRPGTEITLEQGPVGGGIWLPTRFEQNVRATVLFFWSHNRSEVDSYWDYQREGPSQTARR